MPLTIKSPCHMSWSAMAGDDQRRFCGSCQKHVHNLSELTAAEVNALFAESADRCVRAMVSETGELLTKPCAEPPAPSRRYRWLGVGAGAAAAAGAAWVAGSPPAALPAAAAQLRAWFDQDVLGHKPPPPPKAPRHIMGIVDFSKASSGP